LASMASCGWDDADGIAERLRFSSPRF
jgi:hypothetical protein